MRESTPRLRRRAQSCALLVTLGLLFSTVAPADSITIDGGPGASPTASIIPFGGLTQDLKNAIDNADGSEENPLPKPRFQQVYDASSFTGFEQPLRIEEIAFFTAENQPDGNPGLLGGTTCSAGFDACGLFTVQISTTTLGINTLSDTDYLSNLQGGQRLFTESVLLNAHFESGKLTFTGTPYTYDPSEGNLIIDIQITDFLTSTDLSQNLGRLFFEGSQDGGEGPEYSIVNNFNGLDNSGFGLVTQLEYTLVPEPSTGLLVAIGLVGLGARGRGCRS